MSGMDENLIPIIITLNQKGYKTSNCCSAHVYRKHNSGEIYIMFEDESFIPSYMPEGFTTEFCYRKGKIVKHEDEDSQFKFELVPTSPEVFRKNTDTIRTVAWNNQSTFFLKESYGVKYNDRETISKDKSFSVIQKEIFDKIQTLLEWAEGLPEREIVE